VSDDLFRDHRAPEGELAQVWSDWKVEASPQARERLILHYASLVKFVAGRVGAGLPPSVDSGDLISYGFLGLIDALDKFDPSREIKFETYAIPRIRGAILDELRALDWVPRSVRSKARELERAMSKLQGELKRDPTEEELADALGLDVGDLQDRLGEVSGLTVVALEELLTVGGERGETVSVLDTIADTTMEKPGESVEAAETRGALLDALGTLGERERMVVALYYFEGFTLSQIGEVLGVTESRVSQIHSKAVLYLRTRMARAEDDPAPRASGRTG
jgi:RNA polymerase sigma factor FliA